MTVKIGKHMTAQRHPPGKGKTCQWLVRAGDGIRLGIIRWRSGWRRYIFAPDSPTEFDAQCMRDLAQFLDDNKCTREA